MAEAVVERSASLKVTVVVGVVAAALEVALVVAVASYEKRLAPVVATAVAVVVAEDSKWVLEPAAAMVAS